MIPNRLKHRWSQWQTHVQRAVQFARSNRLNAPISRQLKRLRLSFLDLTATLFRRLIFRLKTLLKRRFPGANLADEYPYPFTGPIAVRSFLKQHIPHIIAGLLLAISVLFIIAFFIPVSISFEGNIISRQVSFTNRVQRNQLLINSMRSISRLEIEGLQANPVTLWGEFRTDDDSEDINELNEVEMTLPSPDSKLIFETGDPDNPSQLEIQSLRLPPGTQVRYLAYDPERHQLSLSLNPPEEETPKEETPEEDTPEEDTPGIRVQLALGGNPLQVMAEYVRSPQLQSLPSDNGIAEETEIFDYNQEQFSWTPFSTELNLLFPNEITLYIDLPDLQGSDYQDWFWGGFEVTDVDFTYNATTANVPDELVRSTILEGQIKFLNQDLLLESEQFLVLPSSSKIQRIPRLQLHPDSPAGLQVRLQGKTNEVAVGLDPNFPVRRLKSNFWEQRLSRELITVLLTVCSVMIGYLIPWLFT
ncbi:MAG: hypothetical protein EYR95_17195 [Phormidium sp. SL48-SHIP]|nr:MAG: hypothetical protein EYR95_17195 [Phormidium sp. SL48-SHIP]